jgi:hypothetical protein
MKGPQSLHFNQRESAVQRAAGFAVLPFRPSEQCQIPCKTMPNLLQNDALVHNLSRNTPAMPMVASAATHKLSGFFMPDCFSA